MDFPENARFWIGVASRDHVNISKKGGFCQLGQMFNIPASSSHGFV